MEQDQESQGHYWIQQPCKVHQGNREVQIDYPRDYGEPFMDNLLDRSGLFDELVCQILDESLPNKETEENTLIEQGNQPVDAALVEEKFQGLGIMTPADDVPLTWTKSNTEMSHENAGHLKFPPGIVERPSHPASFDAVYQGIPSSNGQESATPVTRVPEQPLGKGITKQSCGNKNMTEFVQSSHFMKGDHLEASRFNENFSGRPMQGKAPSSGGDCGGSSLPVPESHYGPPTLDGLSQRNRMMGFRGNHEGRRSSPVPDDPHQYFRQRASAVQQANSRELFLRQNRPPLPFTANEQHAMNLPLAQNLDLKAQLMQMNLGNNWENFNKLVTKGNLNLRTSSMAFGHNQYHENIDNVNSSCGQNRLPNYQFSLQRMASQQGSFPPPNQNHGMQTPSGLGGQFQQQPCPSRPQFYNQLANQNLNNWQPPQQCPLNDNQNYLDHLHVQLESCYYQFYSMEKERKKTEMELSRLNPGRRISSANTIQNPQLPDNPTSLDRMIVDFYKEHSRVYTLMSKIGGLCAEALHPNIDACLDNWVEAIQEAGIKRKDELRRLQDGNAEWSEQRGYVLIDVIQKLAKATRSIRTALWSALQMSKEKAVLQDNDGSATLME